MKKEPVKISTVEFVDFSAESDTKREKELPEDIIRLAELKLDVRAILGTVKATVGEIGKFEVGEFLEVARVAGHTVDAYVGDEKIAIGEMVTIDDNFGLSIKEVLSKRGEFLKNIRKNGETE